MKAIGHDQGNAGYARTAPVDRSVGITITHDHSVVNMT